MAAVRRNRINEKPLRRPGEIYLEKSPRGTFGEQTYGVYVEGDETLEGSTVTLGLFFNEEIARNFLKSMKGSELLEKIRRQMFNHREDFIPIDYKISISSEEWEQKHPELVKYRQP